MPNTLLTAVRPLMRDTDQLTIQIARGEPGSLKLTLIPKLTAHNPDETQPEVAALQAALARPMVVQIADTEDDPDGAVVAALTAYTEARTPALDGLSELRAALASATEAAKTATVKTQAKAAAKPAAKPAPANKPAPAAKPAPTEADAASTSDAAVARPPKPVPAALSHPANLFD